MTYVDIPSYALHPALLVFAVLAGPLIGLAAVAFVRLIGWVSHHQLRGRWLLIGPLLVAAGSTVDARGST